MAPASVKICDAIAPSIAPMNETRLGVLPVVIEKSNRFAMMSAVAEIRLDRRVVKTSNVIVLSPNVISTATAPMDNAVRIDSAKSVNVNLPVKIRRCVALMGKRITAPA